MATCAVCELHAESTFKVEGMDCREEVALIERRFMTLAGVEAFSADVMAQRLHVKYDAAKLSASAIAGAVADAGMRAWLEHEEPIASGESGARRRSALLIVSGPGRTIPNGVCGPGNVLPIPKPMPPVPMKGSTYFAKGEDAATLEAGESACGS